MYDIPVPNLPEAEQTDIVRIANAFKQQLTLHGKEKKAVMAKCYNYLKNKLDTDDLLPLPKSQGQDNDANTGRPQVFIPVSRQQAKLLYSGIKQTLFPNDTDFVRIRAKSNKPLPEQYQQHLLIYEQLAKSVQMMGLPVEMLPPAPRPLTYVDLEHQLTEAFKFMLRENQISEKLGMSLLDCIWAGFSGVYPCVKENTYWEWQPMPGEIIPGEPVLDEMGQPVLDELGQPMMTPDTEGPPSYGPVQITERKIDVDVWNPLWLHVDPSASDPERAGWGYFTQIRVQELRERPGIMNADKLDTLNDKNLYNRQQNQDLLSINDADRVLNQITHHEEHCEYDLYYFPHLKTQEREYRNIIVGIAGNKYLVEFKPNLLPKGINPVVFYDWMPDRGSPYGTGPIEDMADIQKTINIMQNYMLETMARNGNRFIASEQANIENLFGVAGGIVTAPHPVNQHFAAVSGDYIEPQMLQDSIGTLKAEAQIVSGGNAPFQGASNIDFKKTATEIQVLQENNMSISREVVEHMNNMGIQRVMGRLMILAGRFYEEPISIDYEDPMTGERQFQEIDMSLLASGEYTVEMVGINPAQSKAAQVEGLSQIFNVPPEMIGIYEPFLKEIGKLQGIRNTPDLIQEVLRRFNAERQQALLAAQASMGIGAQPPVDGASDPGTDPGQN